MTSARVLHVSSGRAWRGGEAQILHLMRGLAGRGLPQRLLAPRGGALARRAREAGLPVEPIPFRNEADGRALARVVGAIRRLGPAVAHLHTSQAHGIGAVAARLAGRRRPAVVVTRRVEYSIFRHSFLGLDRLKYDPGADLVLCVSERIRDVLLADGLAPERLVLVPDGIDVGAFAPLPGRRAAVRRALGIADGAVVVGSVGVLERAKGQDVLVEAFARVRTRHPDA
ncbi:MAG: glycosyltransferase, partial [Planctomycetota bacterium]